MSEVPKTVWVTKYALSDGLLAAEAMHLPSGCARVAGHWPDGKPFEGFMAGSGFAATREAAVARANEMKVAKIASLKRQIERLESLEF